MALERVRTILIHEWVAGGGLVGRDLPASWAAQGLAMRRAIAADFACIPGRPIQVIVTSDARLPDEAGPWTTVRIASGDDLGRVVETAAAADCTVLIAPETSGILAGLTRDFDKAGARLLGSTADAVELAADKARMGTRLEELSIRTPPSRAVVPAAGLPRDAKYPAVLKPIDGAGSLDTFFVPDAQDLPAGAGEMPVALFQPFIPGSPMSASFLVGQEGQTWPIGVGIQRMVVREGRFHYLGGRLPAKCPDGVHQLLPAVHAITGLRDLSELISSGTRKSGMRRSSTSTHGRRRRTSG